MTTIPTIITCREAAQLLGVGPREVRRLVALGRLEAAPVDSYQHLFLAADVEALAEARRLNPPKPTGRPRKQRPEPEALAA